MKIIAKTEPGFMVEIGKSELEKLTGFYYRNSKYSIGQEIVIDKLYEQLQYLIKFNDEIKKISHSLKTAAGMLEKIDPIFHREKEK